MRWRDWKFQNSNNDLLSHLEISHKQGISGSGDSSSKPQKFGVDKINVMSLLPTGSPAVWFFAHTFCPVRVRANQDGWFKSPSCIFGKPPIAWGDAIRHGWQQQHQWELEVRWGETEQGSRCFSKRSSTQHWENILAVKIQRLDNSSDSPVQSKITREWRIWEIWNHADGKCTVLWSGTHQYVSPAAKVLSNVIHY